ncbi:MAG TPA: hypothetical protein VMH03_02545 [Terriglobales bacterium]|nr:hypothetical protein [Terriglobales bacterium]
MKPCRYRVLWIFLLMGIATSSASDQATSTAEPASSSQPITKQTRMDLIRAFQSELVYIRALFPMGKQGLTLKDGVISPGAQELQALIATWGPSVKPGDQARISAIDIKGDRIRFEINGGPVKKEKWYQHIQVGGAGGTAPIAPSDANANPRGSYVDLVFDHYVPDLNPQQLKQLLHPVFDFDAKSALDAYLEVVPPKARDAIKHHQVLVGMNREMVMYAKGRPPNKVREKDGETEYEDWIYGEPPQDVDFVRFVGDEVVRVETMKVDGEKIVRTTKEIDLAPPPSVAKASQTEKPPNAPTLRRPGEELPNDSPRSLPSSPPPPPPQTDPPPSGNSPNFLE